MPRRARIDAPGALHHLIVRGIERRRIFQDDLDRDHFLDRLGAVLTDASTACYAWALLPNHVHLLLRTGTVPIATVMRRLLTGYAVSYNRRHRRHGHLFQNRYKSILCQEEPYCLQLVRYIHLNPLRAQIVPNLRELDRYCFTGHSAILGKRKTLWQDCEYVLRCFARKAGSARQRYRAYVEEGIEEGRRPDLIGGGLIRSLGGWAQVKGVRKRGERLKGDERILGDSEFISEVLQASEEHLERQYQLKAQGYDLPWLSRRVAHLFGMKPAELFARGKHAQTVKARSVYCCWAAREFGQSATALARTFGLSQPAVSVAIRRGEKLARELGIQMLET